MVGQHHCHPAPDHSLTHSLCSEPRISCVLALMKVSNSNCSVEEEDCSWAMIASASAFAWESVVSLTQPSPCPDWLSGGLHGLRQHRLGETVSKLGARSRGA